MNYNDNKQYCTVTKLDYTSQSTEQSIREHRLTYSRAPVSFYSQEVSRDRARALAKTQTRYTILESTADVHGQS